jgi:hypothetical protein
MHAKEESPLVSRAFDLIKQTPGIDTPRLCIMLHWPPVPDPNLRGVALANWLTTHHDCAWEETCGAVDLLIEEGDIFFSIEDGSLRASSS